MPRYIVNDPRDIQLLFEHDVNWRYYDPRRVVWDERAHGRIPIELEAQVGGLIREGDKVTFDPRMFQAQQLRLNALKTAKEEKERLKLELIERFKITDPRQATGLEELKVMVSDLYDLLGEQWGYERRKESLDVRGS